MINLRKIAVAALLAGGSPGGMSYAQEWTEISGEAGGITREMAVVVRNRQDWEALWREHDRRLRPARVPFVDFSLEWVVGVFMGSAPQAGRSIDIELIDSGQPAPLTVKYRWVLPGDEEFAAEVMTSPFKLIKIRSGYARVEFERLPSIKRTTKNSLGFGPDTVRRFARLLEAAERQAGQCLRASWTQVSGR